jgi:hypothetical protein
MDQTTRCPAHMIEHVPGELVCTSCGKQWPLGTPEADAIIWERLAELSHDLDTVTDALARAEDALVQLHMAQCAYCSDWHPERDPRHGARLLQSYACTSCLPEAWAALLATRSAHRDATQVLINRRALVRWALHSGATVTGSQDLEKLPARGAWQRLVQVDPALDAMMRQARRTDGASIRGPLYPATPED